MLKVTEVRIHLLDQSDSSLKAYANVTFNDCFVIHGIRVIQGDKGLFIGMPRRKRQDGSMQDIAHPINQETREMIQSKVLSSYQQALEGVHSESQAVEGPSPKP
jgi:stage V sporulation protein G